MLGSVGAFNTHRVCDFDAALASDVSSLGKFDFEEGFPHIADDGPFFSTRAGNASYQVAWYSSDASQRGGGYISLLPGGMMNIRENSGDSRNVTSFAILADVEVPPRKLLQRTHSASVGTLVPLFHLGSNPHERVTVGFTEYSRWGTPAALTRPYWCESVKGQLGRQTPQLETHESYINKRQHLSWVGCGVTTFRTVRCGSPGRPGLGCESCSWPTTPTRRST